MLIYVFSAMLMLLSTVLLIISYMITVETYNRNLNKINIDYIKQFTESVITLAIRNNNVYLSNKLESDNYGFKFVKITVPAFKKAELPQDLMTEDLKNWLSEIDRLLVEVSNDDKHLR